MTITPKKCASMNRDGDMDPDPLNPNPGAHAEWEYWAPAYSPCGKYVAHRSDTLCNTIEIASTINPTPVPHDCMCRADTCACGDFVSHEINVPCTLIVPIAMEEYVEHINTLVENSASEGEN